MVFLPIVSVVLEVVIAVIGIMIAAGKRRSYGWFIALTFAIYTFYDLASFLALEIPKNILNVIFFIATVSIFWAVLNVYKGD